MKNEFIPITKKLNILLADDDLVDCALFKDALEELPIEAQLTIVNDGEQLIEQLTKEGVAFPDVLFLDLNMPRKNGFASLGEIKRNAGLEKLPVIVISTASEKNQITQVFRDAAHYYIQKPAKFSDLKEVIYKALAIIAGDHPNLPKVEDFELKSIIDEIKFS